MVLERKARNSFSLPRMQEGNHSSPRAASIELYQGFPSSLLWLLIMTNMQPRKHQEQQSCYVIAIIIVTEAVYCCSPGFVKI